MTLDPRFEDLARAWLNILVTWRPLLLLADVAEENAADPSGDGGAVAKELAVKAARHGIPCLALCTALESEVVGLREEPEFLAEYLASFGLREAAASTEVGDAGGDLRVWRPRAGEVAQRLPRLLNLQTYYTAGEKEARAWMCSRVRKDGSSLPFDLPGLSAAPQAAAAAVASPKAAGRSGKGSSGGGEGTGVPAGLAAKAIHTSFESRVKGVDVWRMEDLEELGVSEAQGAKVRARAVGKVRRLPAQALVEEGDVVEFTLS